MTRGRNGVRLISRRTGVIEGIRARKLAGKEFRPAHQPLPALRVEESGSRLQECHPHGPADRGTGQQAITPGGCAQ